MCYVHSIGSTLGLDLRSAMKQKVHIEAQLNVTETGPYSPKEFKGKVERDLFITGSPLGVEHFSDFDGFSYFDGNQNFVDIDPKGEKWAQAVSQNFVLECVDTPNIDSLRYISNQEMVIYDKDYATIVNEGVKGCGSPLGVEHISDFDGFSDFDGNQNFVDIDPKGEKWAQAVSQNFDLECVDAPNIDGLGYISSRRW